MRNAHFVVVVLVGLGACSDSPVSPRGPTLDTVSDANLAAIVSTTNVVVPLDLTSFVPCANGGAGEFVHVTGSLHEIFIVDINATGGVLIRSHFQPQGATGVGLTTGDKYQATGVTQDTEHFGTPLPIVATFINNFRLIGAGRDNNFLLHQVQHITISANGVVTSTVDNLSVACR